MKRYLIAWAVLFVLTLATWYLVGVLEIGVADGSGVPPLWLRALRGTELALLWPIGYLALALDPSIGNFRLGSFAAFAVTVALNSALLLTVVWLILRGLTALGRRDPGSRD